jgi:hypothetical protein
MIDVLNGCAVSGGDVSFTTDGAQTWDAQFTFVDLQTGWAIARANGETARVKTSNGRTSWNEIKAVIAPCAELACSAARQPLEVHSGHGRVVKGDYHAILRRTPD